MFFFQNLLSLGSINDSDLFLRISQSIPNASCGGADNDDQEGSCRDDAVALRLKLVAIAAILLSSLAGIDVFARRLGLETHHTMYQRKCRFHHLPISDPAPNTKASYFALFLGNGLMS